MLPLDPIGNVIYYFVLVVHGKSELESVHCMAEKCVGSNMICPKKVDISEAEIAEEYNRTKSFGEKGFFFICRHCKQLLPQINSCCQEVMQNNAITSPWSNHCC